MKIPTSVFTAMKLTAKNALDTASGWTLKKLLKVARSFPVRDLDKLLTELPKVAQKFT